MNTLNIQIPEQKNTPFFLFIACFFKKRNSDKKANDQLQWYLPQCTEFIATIYLMQVVHERHC